MIVWLRDCPKNILLTFPVHLSVLLDNLLFMIRYATKSTKLRNNLNKQ
jgi:hypothetical protein